MSEALDQLIIERLAGTIPFVVSLQVTAYAGEAYVVVTAAMADGRIMQLTWDDMVKTWRPWVQLPPIPKKV